MSNEELAQRIRDGETELTLKLWKQVKRFVVLKAVKFSYRPGKYETEDLVQAGFIALLRAIEAYTPEGGASFLHFLTFYLKAEFPKANGIDPKHGGRLDPLEDCTSLDLPLSDEWDADTLEDQLPDTRDSIGEADRRIWLEQLREALDGALDQLPEDLAGIIRMRYYDGLTQQQAADAERKTRGEIKHAERRGLDAMRRNAVLEQYVDERTNFYWPTEKAVIYREQLREELKHENSY